MFSLSSSKIEGSVDDARRGMANTLRSNPLDMPERYEKQLEELEEA